MDHVLRHVSVEPGDNVVARFGNAAGVFSTRTDAEADRVEELMEALEAAGQATPFPGEDLARRVPHARISTLGTHIRRCDRTQYDDLYRWINRHQQ